MSLKSSRLKVNVLPLVSVNILESILSGCCCVSVLLQEIYPQISWEPVMLSTLGIIFSSINIEIFFLFFLKNRIRHFMQISIGENGIWYFMQIVSIWENRNLKFHANCLQWGQFAWKVKSCFLRKIRKISPICHVSGSSQESGKGKAYRLFASTIFTPNTETLYLLIICVLKFVNINFNTFWHV